MFQRPTIDGQRSKQAEHHKRLVYILTAKKAQSYTNGKSRIIYIGTTGKGTRRPATSAVDKASEAFGELHGVREIEAFIVTSTSRKAVRTWQHLESSLLAIFLGRYLQLPKYNKKGNGGETGDGNGGQTELTRCLIWRKQCHFRLSPFCQTSGNPPGNPPPQAVPSVNYAPNGIANSGTIVGSPTVTNNFLQSGMTYSYNGTVKKTISGGRINIEMRSADAILDTVEKMKQGQNAAALEEAQTLSGADPQWATPHIEAAFALLNMGNIGGAKAELQAAKKLVPSGYEFEDEYEPHFKHLEDAIRRHDPSQMLRPTQ